jgi:uridine kinase
MDSNKFVEAITQAKAKDATKPSFLIVEGFQLLYDSRVAPLLDCLNYIEIDHDECFKRRSAPRSDLNRNPLSEEKFENNLWPQH